jgi:hypothetical protein
MSQCVYYHHARRVIVRLYPEQKYGADIDRLVMHITHFSLSALKELAQQKNANSNTGNKRNWVFNKHGAPGTNRR